MTLVVLGVGVGGGGMVLGLVLEYVVDSVVQSFWYCVSGNDGGRKDCRGYLNV